jgi:tetratricopeptide (TPR) repeat protein
MLRAWVRGRRYLGVVFFITGTFLGFAQATQGGGQTVPKQNPDAEALLQQGFQLHQQGRFAESIPILEQVRLSAPRNYFANLLLGIDLLRSGKAVEAIPRLKLASLVRPSEEFPEDYLAEAEASLGNNALAAEAYRRALQRGHNSEQATEAWAGFALERFRQIGESLRASQRGLEAIRRIQAAAVNRQGSRPSTQNFDTSIPILERRLQLKPQKDAVAVTETRYQLSLCYATAAGQAAERLRSAADGQMDANIENKAAAFRLRGDVLLRLQGDGTAAQAEYKKSVALEPNNPTLLERLAEAQLSSGDMDAARESAKAALAIDPHQRDALRTLVALAMNAHDYEQALPLLRQLSTEAPGDPAIAIELGRALAQTGQPDEALKWLGSALAAGYPDEKGSSHALQARLLRKLGREQEAVKAEAESRRLSDMYQSHSHATQESQPQRPASAATTAGPDGTR